MGVDETRPPDVSALHAEVQDVQGKVEGWVAQRLSTTTALADSHSTAMAQGTGTCPFPIRPPHLRAGALTSG